MAAKTIYFATAGDFSNFQVWEALAGTRLRHIKTGPPNTVGTVVASKLFSGGTAMVAGLRTGIIVRVNLLDSTVRTLANVRGLTSISVNSAGSLMAVGNSDGGVCMFSLPADSVSPAQPMLTYRGHSGPVTTVAFDTNLTVLSGSTDKLMYRWAAITGKEIQCCEGHDSEISCIAPLSDLGAMSASGLGEGMVKIWHMDLGAEIRSTPPEPSGVAAIAAHPAQALLYVATKAGEVKAWDLKSMEQKGFFKPRQMYNICSLWVSDNNEYLLVATDIGRIYVVSTKELFNGAINRETSVLTTGSRLATLEVILSGSPYLNTTKNPGTNI